VHLQKHRLLIPREERVHRQEKVPQLLRLLQMMRNSKSRRKRGKNVRPKRMQRRGLG
jgi:hypothetical protein